MADRSRLLLVPYVLLCGGIALTDPLMSQRFSAVMPILAIVAGAGLAWLARLAVRVVPRGGGAARLAVALLVAVSIGIGNVRWLASEDRQEDAYGDLRTTMMWDIGWRLREGGAGCRACFSRARPTYTRTASPTSRSRTGRRPGGYRRPVRRSGRRASVGCRNNSRAGA